MITKDVISTKISWSLGCVSFAYPSKSLQSNLIFKSLSDDFVWFGLVMFDFIIFDCKIFDFIVFDFIIFGFIIFDFIVYFIMQARFESLANWLSADKCKTGVYLIICFYVG